MSEPNPYRRTGTVLYACVTTVVAAAAWFYTLTGDHVWAWFGITGFGLTAADELDRPPLPRDLPLPDPTREDTP